MRILTPLLWLLGLLVIGGAVPNQGHALNTNHRCSYCHVGHSAPGFSLLNQANQANSILTTEVVCLNCHGPTGIATRKADVHNQTRTDWRRISCRECHDAHTNKTNSAGGTNLKMVGYVLDPANLNSGFATAKIRRIDNIDGDHRSHSAVATVQDVLYANAGPVTWDFADGSAPYTKLCETCHSDRDFADHEGGDRRNRSCLPCHGHAGGFPRP
jgi:hypothetical protein